MGGGESRDKVSPAYRGPEGRKAFRKDVGKPLSEYHTKPRAFISFHIKDEAQVNLLRAQAKDPRYDIEFTDSSVKEPFDEKWKTQCRERIKKCDIMYVAIGEETYDREAVLWEIKTAYDEGVEVIGVRLHRDENHKIPQQLKDHGAKIIYWDLDEIQKENDKVMREKQE